MKDAEKDAERVVRRWLTYALESMVAHEQELGLLDAAAGDGDHGATMVRGLRAAHAAANTNKLKIEKRTARNDRGSLILSTPFFAPVRRVCIAHLRPTTPWNWCAVHTLPTRSH